MTDAELVELHDLAARRHAHYRWVLGRLRDARSRILARAVDGEETRRMLERFEARFVECEGEAAGEVVAFREALGRRPPRRRAAAP